jgi:hypothetical protein
MPSTDGSRDIEVLTQLCVAVDTGDAAALGPLLHDDVQYEFVSQATHHGRDAVLSAMLGDVKNLDLTRDWFTADGSGRVWWRYAAQWIDADSHRPRRRLAHRLRWSRTVVSPR